MTHPLTLPQAVRLLRAQGDDQHAQVLEDMLDAAPFGDYEAERNQEPPLHTADCDCTLCKHSLVAEQVLDAECAHPFVNNVCVECGLVIGLPRMHPEES